jgi:glycosyl hydrolase family 108/predicted peptidoglycan binding protein
MMRILMSVSQVEMDLIGRLKSLGWLTIPKDVNVVIGGEVMPPPLPVVRQDTGVVSEDGKSYVDPVAAVAAVSGGAAGMPAPAPAHVSAALGGIASAGAAAGVGALAAAKGGFDVVFPWVIQWEGGYSNDEGDPGGATMYGIDTKDDSLEWRALGVTDIRNLTLEQAKGIYLKKYWLGAECNKMPSPVAETHFNYAVNVGAFQSVKFMQRALGRGLTDDGQYGPLTQTALASVGWESVKEVAIGMVDQADTFYRELAKKPNFAKDLGGWLARNNDLRKLIDQIS